MNNSIYWRNNSALFQKNYKYINTYTWFSENRATKTCQPLALIGNIMPLLTGKVKSHLKKILEYMSFHLIETLLPWCIFSEIFTDFCQSSAGYLEPTVKSWGWVVLKGDFYFYTKSIAAFSKLSFERLPAMCWTWLKISGIPVFKTPRRHKWIKFINICYKGQFVLSVSLTVFDPQLHQILPYVGNPNFGIWQIFAWGIRNPRKFCRLNPENWTLESRIPIKIRIQNPSSTEKDWNPVPGIGNPRRGVQNPSLSWISFLGW